MHVIDYWNPVCGVIKKQIKVVSKSLDEYKQYWYYKEHIIEHIDHPEARSIKFNDDRKLTDIFYLLLTKYYIYLLEFVGKT